jgi:hypothetical protein
VNAFAIHEGFHLLSVGGWFDTLYLFDLRTGEVTQEIPHRGQVLEASLIPDYPTLAVAGEYGLTLWRPGAGEVFSYREGHPRIVSVAFTYRRILALDASRQQVLEFPYRGIPIQRKVKVSDKEIWSLAADSKGRSLYVGGADGNLYVLPVDGSRPAAWPLHTQGVTSLALAEPYLASSSDDKTIAVWQIPAMKVIWRSKAHGFLINTLYLNRNPQALWSTSSDGTLKKWSWHQLDELEVIDIAKLLGKKASMSTLWVEPGEQRILAGTHRGLFVALEKGPGGAWKVQETPTPSMALYSCAEAAEAGVVLFAGQEQFGCYLYDLKARRLEPAGSLETCPFWFTGGPPGRSALVAGMGALVTYDVRRETDGAVACGLRGYVNTDFGAIYVAAWVPGRDLLALGNAEGEICFVRGQDLRGDATVVERSGPR